MRHYVLPITIALLPVQRYPYMFRIPINFPWNRYTFDGVGTMGRNFHFVDGSASCRKNLVFLSNWVISSQIIQFVEFIISVGVVVVDITKNSK